MSWEKNGLRFLILMVFSTYRASAAYGSTIARGVHGCLPRCQLFLGTDILQRCIEERFTACTISWRLLSLDPNRHRATPLTTSPSTTATGKGSARTIGLRIFAGQRAVNSARIRIGPRKGSTRDHLLKYQLPKMRNSEKCKEYSCLSTDVLEIVTGSSTLQVQTRAWSTPLLARREFHYTFLSQKHSMKSVGVQWRDKTPWTTSTETKATIAQSTCDGRQDQSSSSTRRDGTEVTSYTTLKRQSKFARREPTHGRIMRHVPTQVEKSRDYIKSTLLHNRWHRKSRVIHLDQLYVYDRTLDGALDKHISEVTMNTTAHNKCVPCAHHARVAFCAQYEGISRMSTSLRRFTFGSCFS